MRGYNTMLEKIEPSKIICFGTPFTEMDGNIVAVNYSENRKVVRLYGRQRNFCKWKFSFIYL